MEKDVVEFFIAIFNFSSLWFLTLAFNTAFWGTTGQDKEQEKLVQQELNQDRRHTPVLTTCFIYLGITLQDFTWSRWSLLDLCSYTIGLIILLQLSLSNFPCGHSYLKQ